MSSELLVGEDQTRAPGLENGLRPSRGSLSMYAREWSFMSTYKFTVIDVTSQRDGCCPRTPHQPLALAGSLTGCLASEELARASDALMHCPRTPHQPLALAGSLGYRMLGLGGARSGL